MNKLLISFVLGFALSASALARSLDSEAAAPWVGEWSSGGERDVRMVLNRSGAAALVVDGVTMPITTTQLSPDGRTLIAHWENGEGTFIRSDDGTVVGSLFDRRFPLRMFRMERR
jgi:hypothetical protein